MTINYMSSEDSCDNATYRKYNQGTAGRTHCHLEVSICRMRAMFQL